MLNLVISVEFDKLEQPVKLPISDHSHIKDHVNMVNYVTIWSLFHACNTVTMLYCQDTAIYLGNIIIQCHWLVCVHPTNCVIWHVSLFFYIKFTEWIQKIHLEINVLLSLSTLQAWADDKLTFSQKCKKM